jgi:uncharacterized delta-60 repeat protein
VETRVPGGRPAVAGIEALPGGKLLLAGSVGDRTVVLMRYRRDGTLDRRFGRNGVRTYVFDRDVTAHEMAIDGEGRILLAGALGSYSDPSRDALVLRFDRAGRPDSTFDGDGIALVDFGGADDATAIALMPDGRMAIAAAIRSSEWTELGIARLDAGGRVEPGFGDGGFARLRHHERGEQVIPVAIAVLPDNRLAIGANYSTDKGSVPLAFRLQASGAPDPAFGESAGLPGWQYLQGLTGISDGAGVADLALQGSSGQLLATGSGFPSGWNLSLWLADAGASSTPGVVSLGPESVWGTRLAFDRAARTLVAGSTYQGKSLGGFEYAELRDMVVSRFGRNRRPTSCFGHDGLARVKFRGRSSRAAALTVTEHNRAVVAGPQKTFASEKTPATFQLARLHNGRCPRR